MLVKKFQKFSKKNRFGKFSTRRSLEKLLLENTRREPATNARRQATTGLNVLNGKRNQRRKRRAKTMTQTRIGRINTQILIQNLHHTRRLLLAKLMHSLARKWIHRRSPVLRKWWSQRRCLIQAWLAWL
jgi:hypothetical protein